jgi:hypothetical protein
VKTPFFADYCSVKSFEIITELRCSGQQLPGFIIDQLLNLSLEQGYGKWYLPPQLNSGWRNSKYTRQIKSPGPETKLPGIAVPVLHQILYLVAMVFRKAGS